MGIRFSSLSENLARAPNYWSAGSARVGRLAPLGFRLFPRRYGPERLDAHLPAGGGSDRAESTTPADEGCKNGRLSTACIYCTRGQNSCNTVDVEERWSRVNEEVARRLARLRRLRADGSKRNPPMSQGVLAKNVGVPRSAIANIENNRQRPSLEVIYAICNALGEEIHDVLPTLNTLLGRSTGAGSGTANLRVVGENKTEQVSQNLVDAVQDVLGTNDHVGGNDDAETKGR